MRLPFRDELVLTIATSPSDYAPDLRWFVDTIVTLIGIAGDNVSDDIWHRLVNRDEQEDLQKYAASKLYHALESITAHETAVKAGAKCSPSSASCSRRRRRRGRRADHRRAAVRALHQHFPKCRRNEGDPALGVRKNAEPYPELKSIVVPVFEAHA